MLLRTHNPDAFSILKTDKGILNQQHTRTWPNLFSPRWERMMMVMINIAQKGTYCIFIQHLFFRIWDQNIVHTTFVFSCFSQTHIFILHLFFDIWEPTMMDRCWSAQKNKEQAYFYVTFFPALLAGHDPGLSWDQNRSGYFCTPPSKC